MQILETQLKSAAITAGRALLRGRLPLPADAGRLDRLVGGNDGALDNVSALAARWFREHLRKNASVMA